MCSEGNDVGCILAVIAFIVAVNNAICMTCNPRKSYKWEATDLKIVTQWHTQKVSEGGQSFVAIVRPHKSTLWGVPKAQKTEVQGEPRTLAKNQLCIC